MKAMTRFLVLLLAMALLCAAAQAETYWPRQVNFCDEYVTLRAKASTSSASLARVYVGEVVMATGYNSDFSYCCYNGKFGYILNRYLSSSIQTWSEGVFRVAHCNSYISLRDMPMKGANVRAKIPLGAQFDAIYYADGSYDPNAYAYVRYNGQYGWVLWQYVEAVYHEGWQ